MYWLGLKIKYIFTCEKWWCFCAYYSVTLGLLHLQHVFVCTMCTFIAMELPFALSLHLTHMYTGTKAHIPSIL